MYKQLLIAILIVSILSLGVSASELEIDKIEITANGDRLISTSSTSASIDVDPGDELRIEITLENLYDDDSDNDIEDVRVLAYIEDIDDGEDEDDSDTVDVRAGSKKRVTLNLDIPDDASSFESYDIEIRARGYDQNGTVHEDSAEIDLDVEREENELVFETLRVRDADCGGDAELIVEIENVGEDDEYDVELKVYNNELGLVWSDVFDLYSIDDSDEDNIYRKTKRLDVSSLSAGSHSLKITVDYNNGRETLDKRLDFTVDCGSSGDSVTGSASSSPKKEVLYSVEKYSNPNRDWSAVFGEDDEVIVDMPPANVHTPTLEPVVVREDNTWTIVALALGNIALIVFIVLLVLNLRDD